MRLRTPVCYCRNKQQEAAAAGSRKKFPVHVLERHREENNTLQKRGVDLLRAHQRNRRLGSQHSPGCDVSVARGHSAARPSPCDGRAAAIVPGFRARTAARSRTSRPPRRRPRPRYPRLQSPAGCIDCHAGATLLVVGSSSSVLAILRHGKWSRWQVCTRFALVDHHLPRSPHAARQTSPWRAVSAAPFTASTGCARVTSVYVPTLSHEDAVTELTYRTLRCMPSVATSRGTPASCAC